MFVILLHNFHLLFFNLEKEINSPNRKQTHRHIFLCKAVLNKILDLKHHKKGILNVVHDLIKMFYFTVPKVNFLDDARNNKQAKSSVSPGPQGA